MITKDHELIWKAEEYQHHEKSPAWVWMSLGLAFFFAAVALWQQNILFAIFVIIAETMVMTWASRPPQIFEFVVNDTGVHITGHKSHHYEELSHYSIHSPEYGPVELILATQHKISPHVRIQIPDDGVDHIRNYLSDYIQEKKHEETFTDIIHRFVRF